MDLTTQYLGLKLNNPLVVSSCPLSQTIDGIRELEDKGAAAIVMYSLFEEQITLESQHLDHYLSFGGDSFWEASSYFPEAESYNTGPDEYLDLISQAKKAVTIPIIGSLNGVSSGGWIEYAQKIQEAGADALELNVYYIPTNPILTGANVEQLYIDLLQDIKKNVTIPVAVKLSPFFSSVANIAKRLADENADGLVLFNRFYQPDFDLENLEVVPQLKLSDSNELRLPLRWVAILYGRIATDLAITSGIHTHEDVLKSMMAGAKVAMLASELLIKGPGRMLEILSSLKMWMEENEYESIEQMQGSMSQKNVSQPAAFERANYMKILRSFQPDMIANYI